jgi:hypothetical protein
MADKLTYAKQLQKVATRFAAISDSLIDLRTIYFDRGYNSGACVFIDLDVVSLGISASNISNMITMAENLDKFLNASAITEGDYDSTVNLMRTDA